MKCIIAGSRTITDYRLVVRAFILSGFASSVTEIVSGHAARTQVDGKWVDNVDRLGERLSVEFRLKLKTFPANWAQYGGAAGKRRNAEMAYYARGGYLVAVWDGVSHGTYNMIRQAEKNSIKVFTHEVRLDESR